MNDTVDETNEAELTFEQAVEVARKKWKVAQETDGDDNDIWVNVGKNYDLNLFVDIEDPAGKVQAHLYKVFSGRTNTHRWFILCDDARDDHWIDDEPTLYGVLHVYGNGVTPYQFRSYKTYGGWYGPDSDEAPKDVLEALGIDFQPDCEETLDIHQVDNEEIKII